MDQSRSERIELDYCVEYRLDGVVHREDGPAIEWVDGRRDWKLNGKWHREDGPAIEFPDGTREWWQNGLRHRQGGPAKVWGDGRRERWQRSKLHREDGPAVEDIDGTQEWWLGGEEVSEASVRALMAKKAEAQRAQERAQAARTRRAGMRDLLRDAQSADRTATRPQLTDVDAAPRPVAVLPQTTQPSRSIDR